MDFETGEVGSSTHLDDPAQQVGSNNDHALPRRRPGPQRHRRDRLQRNALHRPFFRETGIPIFVQDSRTMRNHSALNRSRIRQAYARNRVVTNHPVTFAATGVGVNEGLSSQHVESSVAQGFTQDTFTFRARPLPSLAVPESISQGPTGGANDTHSSVNDANGASTQIEHALDESEFRDFWLQHLARRQEAESSLPVPVASAIPLSDVPGMSLDGAADELAGRSLQQRALNIMREFSQMSGEEAERLAVQREDLSRHIGGDVDRLAMMQMFLSRRRNRSAIRIDLEIDPWVSLTRDGKGNPVWDIDISRSDWATFTAWETDSTILDLLRSIDDRARRWRLIVRYL